MLFPGVRSCLLARQIRFSVFYRAVPLEEIDEHWRRIWKKKFPFLIFLEDRHTHTFKKKFFPTWL